MKIIIILLVSLLILNTLNKKHKKHRRQLPIDQTVVHIHHLNKPIIPRTVSDRIISSTPITDLAYTELSVQPPVHTMISPPTVVNHDVINPVIHHTVVRPAVQVPVVRPIVQAPVLSSHVVAVQPHISVPVVTRRLIRPYMLANNANPSSIKYDMQNAAVLAQQDYYRDSDLQSIPKQNSQSEQSEGDQSLNIIQPDQVQPQNNQADLQTNQIQDREEINQQTAVQPVQQNNRRFKNKKHRKHH